MWIHSHPEGSDISRFETLKQVEKTTGVTPPDLLSAPTLSVDHDDAWKAYTSMQTHSYAELAAYEQLTGVKLDPWEVSAIMSLSKYRGAPPKWPLKSDH
jgi:hypothetical protein